MKTINLTLTDKAHANLKTLTEMTKTNQSEMLSVVLEQVDINAILKYAGKI